MTERPFAQRFGGAALVTGASAGIGERFARALAARGMDLVIVARRAERLETLAAELRTTHGVRAEAIAEDLVHADAASRLHAEVARRGVDVGLLVNNAGFGRFGPFADDDPEQAVRMVELNCRAPVALTYAFLPAMRARGRGGLIFVASTAAYQPTPWFAVYGATKAFDLMLAEALWVELRDTGIEVLALSPGFTPTEFQEVAGVREMGAPAVTSAEEVVETALGALGRKPSVIPGFLNKAAAVGAKLGPRATVARTAGRVNHPGRRARGRGPADG
jgi:hypothetical protein